MSRLVGVMQSVFGAPPPAPAPAPANPMQTTKIVANTDPTALPPEGNSDAPAPPPLAKFEKFWDTPVVDPKALTVPKSFLDGVTPENVAAAAAKVDFRGSVTPAQIALVAKGGQEGVNALLEVINQVGRDVYTRSALATTSIVAEAKKETRADVDRDLPKVLRQNSIRGSADSKNEAFKNPALAPMIRALETQAAAQNPTATAAEISEMVNDYMTGVAQTLNNPNPTQNQTPKNRGEDVDWEAFGNS